MKKGVRKTLGKLLSAAMAIAMLLTLLPTITATAASAGNPRSTTVGAIRWDAWIGGADPSPGFQVERSLGPNKYHFRLPFFGVETGTDSVQARETTQATMDQDIAYAKSMGLSYWAYVYYQNGDGMDLALDLHLSSAYKNDVNFCYVIERGRLNSTNADEMVARMQLSNYQMVNGGHPLVYLFDDANWTVATLDILRNKMSAAGLATPYVVYMGWSASGASSMSTTLGCQAISAYCTSGSGGAPYASLASNELNNWDSWKATGQKVVPFVTTGWDPRPRVDNPVTWCSYSADSWAQTATATEIADHLNDSLVWANNNQSVTDANTVLMYAWNEFDEGGWISPTLIPGTMNISTERIDAIREVLTGIASNTGFEKDTLGWTAQNASITVNTSANLLNNPGFESGTTGWSAQTCSIAVDTANKRTGTNCVAATSRTAAWGSPLQDVKALLLNYGQGNYNASVWTKFATGADAIRIIIKVNDANGDRWLSGNMAEVDTNYTQLSGNMSITWTGTLNSAYLYVQTASSTASLYLDDFSLAPANKLTNAGFDSGTTGWTAQTCTIAVDTANKRTGVNAINVTARAYVSGSPTQDIKNILLNNGQGTYTTGAWVKFYSGSDNMYTVVKINDGTGDHWFCGTTTSVGTTYTQLAGTMNITWSGTLNSAIMYVQSASSLTSLYLDDFMLTPPAAKSGTNPCIAYSRTGVTGSPLQDVKAKLLLGGQGGYRYNVWAKLATGSDNVSLVVKTNDATGDHYWTSATVSVGAAYTQLTGDLNITWYGTLNSAVVYVQTASSTGTLLLDDLKVFNIPPSAPPTIYNYIANGSFEDGTTSWSAQSSTLSIDTANARTGAKACLASGRTAYYGTPTQDIKSSLLTYGQGYYVGNAWVKLATGTDTMKIVIKTNDGTGDHWFTGTNASVTTAYTQLTGTLNLTWSGTLNSAIMYVQGTSSTANLYLDDFSLAFRNRLINGGFESGTTGWTAQSCTIGVDTANARTGVNACLASGRAAYYGSPTQDIKSILLYYGQGTYTANVYVKFASGSENVNIIIKTNDTNGNHWFSGTAASVGTSYVQLNGSINITWTGTLNSAIIYVQGTSSTANLYLDDFVFYK